MPKGAVHVHGAVVMHAATGKVALDLHPGDVFWCTADPGWVTGTSYGIVTPLVHGVTSIVDEADFDAVRWYRLLAEERVSVWYTAPTAVRMMMNRSPALSNGSEAMIASLVGVFLMMINANGITARKVNAFSFARQARRNSNGAATAQSICFVAT